MLNLYHRSFKIESPARSLMQLLLARYITYGTTVPGTILDRVVSIGESPLKCVFRKCGHNEFILKTALMAMLIQSDYNQRSYSYAKIFVSRDSDRVARDEPHH